ncbi:MAG: hypothetical protein MJE77_29900 [Proteobacteria bacterium]|nr:hypothetical protein [Pseudomonadota bacterium]
MGHGRLTGFVGGDKLYLGSIRQVNRLIQNQPTIEHAGMKCKSHLALSSTPGIARQVLNPPSQLFLLAQGPLRALVDLDRLARPVKVRARL